MSDKPYGAVKITREDFDRVQDIVNRLDEIEATGRAAMIQAQQLLNEPIPEPWGSKVRACVMRMDEAMGHAADVTAALLPFVPPAPPSYYDDASTS